MVQSEEQLDHLLDLMLVGATIPDNSAFHFCRCVLLHFATSLDSRENGNAACMPKLQRASGVGRVEEILDDHKLGVTLREARREFTMDSREATRK